MVKLALTNLACRRGRRSVGQGARGAADSDSHSQATRTGPLDPRDRRHPEREGSTCAGKAMAPDHRRSHSGRARGSGSVGHQFDSDRWLQKTRASSTRQPFKRPRLALGLSVVRWRDNFSGCAGAGDGSPPDSSSIDCSTHGNRTLVRFAVGSLELEAVDMASVDG
jgi:hypothetical protein